MPKTNNYKPRSKADAIAFVENELFKFNYYVRDDPVSSNCIDRLMEYYLGMLQLIEGIHDGFEGWIVGVIVNGNGYEFIPLETYHRQTYPGVHLKTLLPPGTRVERTKKSIQMKYEPITLTLEEPDFWNISLCVAMVENGKVVMKSFTESFIYDKTRKSMTFTVARVYNIPVDAHAYCVSYNGMWYVIDPFNVFSIEHGHEQDCVIPRFNKDRRRPESGYLMTPELIPVGKHLRVYRAKAVTEYICEKDTDKFETWF